MRWHSWSYSLLCGAVSLVVAACASGESAPDAATQGTADASQPTIDAPAEKPDATPGTPDARPAPDAVSFPDAAMTADAGPPADAGPSCGTQNVVTSIDGSEPTYQRYYSTPPECTISPSGNNVYYDVYTYQLTGPGPHMLTASTCDTAAFDSVITIYQAPGGAKDAFDPLNACNNRVAYNDDDAACAGNSSIITATGLEAGEVTIVLAPFSTGTTGAYTIDISSTTCVAN